jgi:hypothetical protein
MIRWRRYLGLIGLLAFAAVAYGAYSVPGAWTRHSLVYVSGSSAIGSLGAATDGQLPIGDTGAKPVLAALTGTAGEVAVTNGAGSITLGFADQSCLTVLAVGVNPTEASATNDFANLLDNTISTTEANENLFTIPIAMKAHSLRATVDVAPGAGNDPWAITLRDDSASTTLTCTIDETATSCTDAVNEPVMAAGSRLAILISSAGGDADPTAAALATVSLCLGL